jgi:hypothetical protein
LQSKPQTEKSVPGFFKLNIFKSIYFKEGLKKMAKKRGAKVFPKSKNGQKKCPIFRRVRILGEKRQKKSLY